MTDEERRQSDAGPQDVLTTVRKRLELVINEIENAEVIAMLKTAMSELDALAQSDAEPFPQPQRNDGGKPCGECHLKPGETCDVCGAKAQSDAEPVAWRYKPTHMAQEWAITMQREPECKSWGWVVEPLYTAPPRPEASAGLIEAAKITREWAGATSSLVEAHLLDALARELHSRAADRSGK